MKQTLRNASNRENKHGRDSPNKLRTRTNFAVFPRFDKPSSGREQQMIGLDPPTVG
jgi:hypothetical protein